MMADIHLRVARWRSEAPISCAAAEFVYCDTILNGKGVRAAPAVSSEAELLPYVSFCRRKLDADVSCFATRRTAARKF